MINIALFASGSGTNAENVANYFENSQTFSVDSLLSNKADAFVFKRLAPFQLKTLIFNKKQLYDENHVIDFLVQNKTDFIVLAGFLWLIPEKLIKLFPGRIINIHPALLPAYGGKGMFGMNVHKAVIDNGEKFSGITIHLVNEEYDKGDKLFQAYCDVLASDTPDSLANRVHALEYKYFPKVIEKYMLKYVGKS